MNNEENADAEISGEDESIGPTVVNDINPANVEYTKNESVPDGIQDVAVVNGAPVVAEQETISDDKASADMDPSDSTSGSDPPSLQSLPSPTSSPKIPNTEFNGFNRPFPAPSSPFPTAPNMEINGVNGNVVDLHP